MNKEIKKILLATLLYVVAFIINKLNINGIINIISYLFFIISYLIVGLEVLEEAFENITKGEVFDENFLMTIATLGAFAIGKLEEAVAVMLFYQVGELLQSYAVDKSKKHIGQLMDIKQNYANLVKKDKYEKVNPEKVMPGDIIVVKPGEKVPLDGTIIEGTSRLDTSSLTGENIPKKVEVGDNILSGMINLNGILKIKVTKNYKESTVSKILDLVENAADKKSKSENFITKFSKVYTPVVVIIALLLAFFPPLILKESFIIWIYRALSFLVVSCPCALVISIPLSFFGGIGKSAKEGILIKGSNYLENLAKSKITVFDKTGTLTEGIFEVQKIKTKDIEKNELLELVAYSEYYSNHPISESIKKKYNKKIDEKRIKNIEEIPGLGIKSLIDDKNILVGNEKLLDKYNIKYDKQKEIGTIIYVSIDKSYKGFILISDKIKEDSKGTINNLRKEGIKKIVMLTGDKKEVAEAVSNKLKIDETYSELLPTDKVEKLQEIINNKKEDDKLIFVGDGINDAAALALSDIGVAMGALGSDAAIEAADIVLMNDEPKKLVEAIKISKQTLLIAKENIYFAISVKIIVLILSALGLSTMWMAVFADVGVSVIAILNALRILYKKQIINK